MFNDARAVPPCPYGVHRVLRGPELVLHASIPPALTINLRYNMLISNAYTGDYVDLVFLLYQCTSSSESERA